METQINFQALPKSFNNVMHSERLIALLGIAAHQQKKKVGACPSDAQLHAFISGELKGKSRQDMLAHLNRCSTCYHHWLETALSIQAFEPADKSNLLTQPWFLKWWQTGIAVFQFPKVLVPVAMTAVLFVMIVIPVWLKQSSTFHDQIAGFEIAVTLPNIDTLKPLLTHFSQETTTFGINEPDIPQAVKAFSAGVEMERATLSQTELASVTEIAKWANNSPWQEEYELGRWFVLLWAMAQIPKETPTDFWVQQQTIGETLQARFRQRSPTDDITETILEMLAETLSLLNQLPDRADNQNMASQLGEHLNFAIWGISSL